MNTNNMEKFIEKIAHKMNPVSSNEIRCAKKTDSCAINSFSG